MANSPSDCKQVLRRQMRERRRAISPADRVALEKAWLVQALAALAFRPGQHVAVYAALGSELNIQHFIELAMARGITVFLPRVIGSAMEFCQYVGQAMASSALGILEPTAPAAALEKLDIILVPLLAVDSSGQRLGQGGGYYDRTLPMAPRALRVGVAFDQQCVDQLPVEPFDQCLDALITPSGARSFTQNHRAAVHFRGRE